MVAMVKEGLPGTVASDMVWLIVVSIEKVYIISTLCVELSPSKPGEYRHRRFLVLGV
jgi:hypothetical protein